MTTTSRCVVSSPNRVGRDLDPDLGRVLDCVRHDLDLDPDPIDLVHCRPYLGLADLGRGHGLDPGLLLDRVDRDLFHVFPARRFVFSNNISTIRIKKSMIKISLIFIAYTKIFKSLTKFGIAHVLFATLVLFDS